MESEKEALSRELFQQLGGKLRCDEYDPEMGVYQIRELDYLHLTQEYKIKNMFLALKNLSDHNCFREDALINVDRFIVVEERKYSDSE